MAPLRGGLLQHDSVMGRVRYDPSSAGPSSSFGSGLRHVPSANPVAVLSAGGYQLPGFSCLADDALLHARSLSEATAESEWHHNPQEAIDFAALRTTTRTDVHEARISEASPIDAFTSRRTKVQSSSAPHSETPGVAASQASQSVSRIGGRPVLYVQVCFLVCSVDWL